MIPKLVGKSIRPYNPYLIQVKEKLNDTKEFKQGAHM